MVPSQRASGLDRGSRQRGDGGEPVEPARRGQGGSRRKRSSPVGEAGDANASLVHVALPAPQGTVIAQDGEVGIVALIVVARRLVLLAAVVAGEDDQGLVAPAALVERRDDPADGGVHVAHGRGKEPPRRFGDPPGPSAS